MEIAEAKLTPIIDLFGNSRFLKKDGRALSERATLIKFFADQLHLTPKRTAVRLGHFKGLDDLYVIKSCFNDRFAARVARASKTE